MNKTQADVRKMRMQTNTNKYKDREKGQRQRGDVGDLSAKEVLRV